MVLDHTKSNQVVASTAAYDTRVAEVISTQPGITLGESGEAKVLVATTGPSTDQGGCDARTDSSG